MSVQRPVNGVGRLSAVLFSLAIYAAIAAVYVWYWS